MRQQESGQPVTMPSRAEVRVRVIGQAVWEVRLVAALLRAHRFPRAKLAISKALKSLEGAERHGERRLASEEREGRTAGPLPQPHAARAQARLSKKREST